MRVNDAMGAVHELAASQYGTFNRRQAAERGVPTRRLRRAELRGEIFRPLPDVFVLSGSPSSWHQRLMAQTLQGDAVASHRSAAALHGFDGFPPDVVEVCVARDSETLNRNAVAHSWRRHDERDVDVVAGIRVTSIERTLVQLGAVVGRSRVEKALDGALRNGLSASRLEETLERLWRPGRTGAGLLRGLIDDPRRLGELPDSWFERLVQKVVSADGLPPIVLQHRVTLRSGQQRRLDLAYPEVKLGIEAHSRRFHFGPMRTEADNVRDLELAAVGWEILYVTWGMAHQPDELVRHLQAIYATRQALVA